jgi:hypothetical protein
MRMNHRIQENKNRRDHESDEFAQIKPGGSEDFWKSRLRDTHQFGAHYEAVASIAKI